MNGQKTDLVGTARAGTIGVGNSQVPKAKRRTQQRGGPRGVWLLCLSLLLLVALSAVGAFAYYWGYGQYRGDRILPGVHVWGINLGGQTTAQATEILAEEWARRRLVLLDGEQKWSLPPEKVGILLDTEATVRAAHAELRQEGDADQPRQVVRQLIASLVSQVPSVQRVVRDYYDPTLAAPKRIEVAPAWRFDEVAASETLRSLANQIEVLPQEAAVKVVDGRVKGTPSSTGRALDISSALSSIEHMAEEVALTPAVQGGEAYSEVLRLPIVPLEPTVKDVSGVVEEASRLLSNSISVALYDPVTDERFTWALTPEITSQWLAFNTTAGNPSKVQLSIAEAKVSETLKEQETALGGGRYVDRQLAVPELIDALRNGKSEVRQRLYHYAKTHTVKAGETLSSIGFDYGVPYGWIMAANPGMDEKVMEGQQITIPSQDNLLPLPVVENKRIKVSIGKQRVQAFEDGVLKWDWPASTGIKSSPTNPGVFQIQSHDSNAYAANWDLWMPQFMGIYRPVPSVDFMNGFHGFPSRDQRQILWTKNLGGPITYGCVMVSTENAKLLYDWADEGVVVEITE